jgi:hypothetical protein
VVKFSKIRLLTKHKKTSQNGLIGGNSFSKRQMLVFIAIFALLGGYFLYKSFAAGPLASFEAENTTLTGAVIAGNDSNASGGKYIQFGGALTGNLAPPIRAAFYYPWFPETWTVNGQHVAYNPLLGYYDSSDQSVVDSHIHGLDYGKMNVAIASWWGVGTHSENTRIPLLMSRTLALGSSLKWALYYEQEGQSDPTVAQIQSDLEYIKTHYVNDEGFGSAYAHVNGKPVIFVYNASANDNTCALADKWAQANATEDFYIDLKVLTNYRTCTNQPDSWHQYGPATAEDNQNGYSFTISPGFWRADEATPRLARDPARWQTNVNNMKASNATWQLITTFNEWGEGTAVEGAQGWNSASANGTYLDALHNGL